MVNKCVEDGEYEEQSDSHNDFEHRIYPICKSKQSKISFEI